MGFFGSIYVCVMVQIFRGDFSRKDIRYAVDSSSGKFFFLLFENWFHHLVRRILSAEFMRNYTGSFKSD